MTPPDGPEAPARLDARLLEIMQHALGLDEYGRGTFYRNHFVTGPGSKDWDACTALVSDGMMARFEPTSLYGGDYCFVVTDAGRQAVREHSPSPPKVSRSQQRYLDYLDADSGYSFGEWLRLTRYREATR